MLAKKEVIKGYINVIRDMYEGVVTTIRSSAEETNEFFYHCRVTLRIYLKS